MRLIFDLIGAIISTVFVLFKAICCLFFAAIGAPSFIIMPAINSITDESKNYPEIIKLLAGFVGLLLGPFYGAYTLGSEGLSEIEEDLKQSWKELL